MSESNMQKMQIPYTPTTEEVRNGYIRSKRSAWQKSYAKEDIEFDRWLEQVEAEAWKEGYVAGFLKAMGGELDGSAREAATRVPVQGEPNDDREAMLRRIESFDYGSDRVSDDLEQDIRELVALSRPTVPDAATEETFAEKMERKHGALAYLRGLLADAVAERDAALARIAEAEKLHYRDTPSVGGDWCPEDHHKWPCVTAIALGLNEGENDD